MRYSPINQNTVLIELDENISVSNFMEFKSVLDGALINEKIYLIIDFSKTYHISSLALSIILNTHANLKAIGGEIIFLKPTESVKKIISVAEIDSLFNQFNTLEEALDYIKGKYKPNK